MDNEIAVFAWTPIEILENVLIW